MLFQYGGKQSIFSLYNRYFHSIVKAVLHILLHNSTIVTTGLICVGFAENWSYIIHSFCNISCNCLFWVRNTIVSYNHWGLPSCVSLWFWNICFYMLLLRGFLSHCNNVYFKLFVQSIEKTTTVENTLTRKTLSVRRPREILFFNLFISTVNTTSRSTSGISIS